MDILHTKCLTTYIRRGEAHSLHNILRDRDIQNTHSQVHSISTVPRVLKLMFVSYITVCRSALQCVAVHYSVSQCVTVCCSASQCVAVRHSVSQCVTVCRSALQCVAVHHSVSQCVTVCRSASQCVAVLQLIFASYRMSSHAHVHFAGNALLKYF